MNKLKAFVCLFRGHNLNMKDKIFIPSWYLYPVDENLFDIYDTRAKCIRCGRYIGLKNEQ